MRFYLNDLTEIIISPSNGQFTFKEDKFLSGKSDSNKDDFDVILFVRRDIKEFSAPSNIEIISPIAFQNCKDLTKVEIPPNSNFETIGLNAFYQTKIEEIYFTTSLKELKEEWRFRTNKLKKLQFQFSYIKLSKTKKIINNLS